MPPLELGPLHGPLHGSLPRSLPESKWPTRNGSFDEWCDSSDGEFTDGDDADAPEPTGASSRAGRLSKRAGRRMSGFSERRQRDKRAAAAAAVAKPGTEPESKTAGKTEGKTPESKTEGKTEGKTPEGKTEGKAEGRGPTALLLAGRQHSSYAAIAMDETALP